MIVGLSVLHVELRLIHMLVIVYWCPVYQTVCQKFWYLFWHKCGDDIYEKRDSTSDEVTLNIMLGDYESMADSANSSTEGHFYCLVANYIQRLNL